MTLQTGKTGLWHTILFADVCGSTKLYDSLGNTRAQAVIARALAILSQAAGRHNGTIVKSIGDEVMCTFPMPHQAVDAALEMQTAIKEAIARSEIDVPTLQIRTGFHAGPVISDGADVFGDAVNLAARVAAHAKPDQILTSRQTVDRLPRERTSQLRFIGNAHIKGKRDALELFEVILESENLTKMQDLVVTHAGSGKLTATFGGRSMEVSEQRPAILMGRGDENDIVVLDPLVSRLHARIEMRRGRFVLIDQSLNGTFVSVPGRKEVAVRRDEFPLMGAGLLALGKSTAVHRDCCIQWAIHSGRHTDATIITTRPKAVQE
ncbi:MAG: adenylate/guanylate cyclase domain-containing protein [Hyphomicrobiaceae bacterium]|nr:adenylate/guanylate cyclase domain-containing protein [Hyphomicrobiaceae bacterium]